jgi:hypothetical protein
MLPVKFRFIRPSGFRRRRFLEKKDLEIATEQLSEYLERDITSDMLQDIKQKVQDKYR